jgi:hypothetical protein
MNENELLNNYRTYLNSTFEEDFNIPEDYVDSFWIWFLEKGRLFQSNRIKKFLRNPLIEIFTNACYKNSYRLLKAFRKNLSYYEGFAVDPTNNIFLRHAFNVNKFCKVCDYSLRQLEIQYEIPNYQIYYGVKIPESFVRKVYQSLGEARYTQYSVLVAYFLFKNNYSEYLKCTNI